MFNFLPCKVWSKSCLPLHYWCIIKCMVAVHIRSRDPAEYIRAPNLENKNYVRLTQNEKGFQGLWISNQQMLYSSVNRSFRRGVRNCHHFTLTEQQTCVTVVTSHIWHGVCTPALTSIWIIIASWWNLMEDAGNRERVQWTMYKICDTLHYPLKFSQGFRHMDSETLIRHHNQISIPLSPLFSGFNSPSVMAPTAIYKTGTLKITQLVSWGQEKTLTVGGLLETVMNNFNMPYASFLNRHWT